MLAFTATVLGSLVILACLLKIVNSVGESDHNQKIVLIISWLLVACVVALAIGLLLYVYELTS